MFPYCRKINKKHVHRKINSNLLKTNKKSFFSSSLINPKQLLHYVEEANRICILTQVKKILFHNLSLHDLILNRKLILKILI